MNSIIAMAGITIFAVILASCRSPIVNSQRGTVHLSIDALGVKTLEPAISMDPACYYITGYGPAGISFALDTTQASIEVEELLIGEWNILVSAENNSGRLIGQGSNAVLVRTGMVQPVSIFVTPIDGTGTFNLAVNWETAAVDIPGLEGELLDSMGNSVPLSFHLSPGAASASGGIVQAGYYTLLVQLTDNGIPVMGAVEVARIVSGAITSGAYDFTHINQPGGSILVNITANMEDPIELEMAGGLPEIPLGSTMSLAASAPAETSVLVYAWYLNGASIAIGESITLGAELEPGYYRVDVTAFTTNGGRAGSTTHQFIVTGG